MAVQIREEYAGRLLFGPRLMMWPLFVEYALGIAWAYSTAFILLLALLNAVYKLKSNMEEVRARGGRLFVLADSDTGLTVESGLRLIHMPAWFGALSPVLHVVALQLLAYHVACLRGTDIDKPRNLAKSVTVE